MSADPPAKPMYSGTYERTLDAKNRVTIPSQWVAQGVADFQVVVSSQAESTYLVVMPPEEFAWVERRIEALEIPQAEKTRAIRAFYSSARGVTADKQGRILLPEDFCRKAGLGMEVVLAGTKSRFEIWDAGKWRAASQADQAVLSRTMEMIGL